jgi:hypothetical protein
MHTGLVYNGPPLRLPADIASLPASLNPVPGLTIVTLLA